MIPSRNPRSRMMATLSVAALVSLAALAHAQDAGTAQSRMARVKAAESTATRAPVGGTPRSPVSGATAPGAAAPGASRVVQGGAAAGVPTSAAPASGDTTAASAATTGAPDTSGTIHGDPLAEVRATFTPENRAYWTTNVALDVFGIVFEIVVALVLLFGRVSARIRDFANARARGRYLRMLIYFTIYSLLSFVIAFPLSWYQGFALEHQYHLSTQTFAKWFIDALKDQGIGIVFFGVVPLVMLAYLAIEKYRRWWIALAIGSVPVVVIATLIQPIVIDPMFNKFTPLHDQVLKAQILALAAKAGIPSRKVYEVDKSAQTVKYNAYVTGFGASQRIVLWDTTLKGMKTDEILYVMGHEMGHYRLHHIWKGIVYNALLAFALFFGAGVFMTWAVKRWGERWGFHELHDIASIPLFGLALTLVSLIAQPGVNAYTRSVEHEADAFGLEVTHTNDAAARAFIKLGSQNKSNPEPPVVLEWFEYTHPPLYDRVKFAIEYHPWTEGKPNKYFKP